MTTLYGIVTLRGANPTHVVFGASGPARVVGTHTETFDLTGVGPAGTIIVNPDGDGEQTATIDAAAGYLTGGGSASTNMTAETDTKLKIGMDGGALVTVTFDWTGCSSGSLIAAEMQTKIRAALGGALVTVAFDSDHYVITSPTLGKNSAIEVDNAADHDCADELDLTDGATPTAGTGDVDDLSAVTLDEIITVCEGDMSGLVVDEEGGALVFESDSVGNSSSLVIGSGTYNAVLGLTGSAEYYGTNGLDYVVSISATSYVPVMTLNGATSIAGKGFSVRNKTAAGFDIYCETAGAADQVGIIVQIDDE